MKKLLALALTVLLGLTLAVTAASPAAAACDSDHHILRVGVASDEAGFDETVTVSAEEGDEYPATVTAHGECSDPWLNAVKYVVENPEEAADDVVRILLHILAPYLP